MKLYRFFAIAAVALLGLGAVSCKTNENEDISKPECKFNAETLEFDANGNLVSPEINEVTLLATRDWTISCDSSFVGIDPLSGKASNKPQAIEITLTKNTGYDRTAIVKANAGKGLAKATLNIKQAGAMGDENEHLLITVAEFIEKADGTNPYVIEGKVSGINTQYKWFNLTDETGTVQIYQPKNFADFELEADGTAKVKGVYELYEKDGRKTHEMKNGTIIEYKGPDTSNLIFRETFTASLGNFTEDVKSGTLTSVWAYDASYKCAKATAFASQKANASESWLISPEIDLTGETAATLTFDHACNYFTAVSREVAVYVSKNGGDFVQIKVPVWPTSFTFVSSDSISLKDFLGSRIKVAFVYTSTDKSAGTYELQNFVINKTDTGETPYPTLAECNSVKDILDLDNDEGFSLLTPVLVVAKTTGGVMVNDATGTAYVYGEGVAEAKIGDKITFKAVRSEYNGVPEITGPEDVTVASSDNEVTYPEATDITGNLDAFTATTPEYISMTGILSTSKNTAGDQTYYNLAVAGATMQGSISLPLESFGLDSMVDKQIKVTGYYNGISGKTTKYQNIIATRVEESDAPYLTVEKTAMTVAADATSATITVGGTATWTATSTDAVTIDPASGTGEGTVTVTFPANTDEENAKTYTVKIATEQEAPVKSYDVVITQRKAGGAAGGSATYTLTFSASTNGTSVKDYTSTWDATCNDFTWTLVNFNNNQNGWAYVKCGRKKTDSGPVPSVATITTKTVIPEAMETVTIFFGGYTAAGVNSAKLYVDTTNDFSSAACQTITITGKTGESGETLTIPNPTQNCYYKLEFDCNGTTSSNGVVQVNKVVYTNE